MFKKKILFFIIFLTIPLSSCSLRKNDPKINQIENKKAPEENKISNLIREKEGRFPQRIKWETLSSGVLTN